MANHDDNQWPGVPCDSDEWPFSYDYFIFEARRAVGQLVRTWRNPFTGNLESDEEGRNVIDYLRFAHVLSGAIETVIEDLVAEARISGQATWGEIGTALGNVGASAAQKHYRGALDNPARMTRLQIEALVVERTAIIASLPPEKTDLFKQEYEGVGQTERIQYAVSIIVETYRKLTALVNGSNIENYDQFITTLATSLEKIRLLVRTLLLDRETWEALRGWDYPDWATRAIPYQNPAVYLNLLLQYVVLIWHQYEKITQKSDDTFEQRMQHVELARSVLLEMMYIFGREDVYQTLAEHHDG